MENCKPMMHFETKFLQLSFSIDHKWLVALKTNGYEIAKALLESATEAEKQRLVNGRFQCINHSKTQDDLVNFKVVHPWNIAAIHASDKILELLIQ